MKRLVADEARYRMSSTTRNERNFADPAVCQVVHLHIGNVLEMLPRKSQKRTAGADTATVTGFRPEARRSVWPLRFGYRRDVGAKMDPCVDPIGRETLIGEHGANATATKFVVTGECKSHRHIRVGDRDPLGEGEC